MGHAAVDNRSGLAVEPLFLLDEDARPVCVVVVKGTYRITPEGPCVPAEQQAPVVLEPIPWGDPETSSLRLDTEAYPFKPATDVVVLGHARAASPVRELLVALQVGALRRGILVLGDRVWVKSAGGVAATAPLGFQEMPLVYERAFGGFDRDHPDARKHAYEPRNPAGVGFRAAGGFQEGLRLPNLEDQVDRLVSFGQRVAPAGCGYLAPHWQPRAAFAGTYDEAWTRDRMPRYPKDFDRRHANGASPGLVADGYLLGNEPFALANVGPRGGLRGVLPGRPPPQVRVRRSDRSPDEELAMRLDTILFFCDEEEVQLVWRAHTVLLRGPHDVSAVEVDVPRGGTA